MLVFMLVLFCFQQYCETTQSNDTDSKLIDLLKNDLRRNNYDYIDKFNDSSPTAHIPDVPKSTAIDKLSDNIVVNTSDQTTSKPTKSDNRRYLDLSAEINYNKYSFSPKTTTPKTTTSLPKSSKMVKSKTTTEYYPKYVAKSQREKFMGFLNENMELVDTFLKNKGLGSQEIEESKPGLRMQASQKTGFGKRAKSELNEIFPSPDQLDLSPAKGGRVQRLRVDGRLCDRNVLLPEGPKYDSAGLVYLKAFSRRPHQGDYPQTRPSRVVLPRCCNCCKKSVLGCQ